MGVQGVFCCVSVVASFVGACSATFLIIDGYRRNRRRGGLATVSETSALDGLLSWYLRNGVGLAKPLARILLQNARVRALVSEAVEALSARGRTTGRESLLSSFCAFTVAMSAIGGLISRSPACAVAVMGCVIFLASFWTNGAKDRRLKEMCESVPDALHSMDVCFQAGLSLLQTFRQIATEVRGPLRMLFDHASHQLETGQSVERALEAFRSEASVPELSFVAVALDVQHEAGGSMHHVLDSVRDAVKGEIELKRTLRVQTAQAKLSAQVVSVLPFALIALFSLMSSDFLTPFFESLPGMALLCGALVMQVMGILLVRRTLAVEVG